MNSNHYCPEEEWVFLTVFAGVGGNDLDAVHKQRKFIKNVDLEYLV